MFGFLKKGKVERLMVLGTMSKEEEDFGEAIEYFDQAVQAAGSSKSLQSYKTLALMEKDFCLRKLGRFDEASAVFAESMRILQEG